MFGAGLALGIAIGAGAAMLTAPQSGADTRRDIRRRAARSRQVIGRRSHDAWLDVRDEIRRTAAGILRAGSRRAQERQWEREDAERADG